MLKTLTLLLLSVLLLGCEPIYMRCKHVSVLIELGDREGTQYVRCHPTATMTVTPTPKEGVYLVTCVCPGRTK